jgi:hypothetical protein
MMGFLEGNYLAFLQNAEHAAVRCVRASLIIGAFGFPGLVAAEPFPRLPDGRVVVEIFGRKVGLPAGPGSLDRISFYPSRTANSTFGNTTFTLRQALAEPEKARRALEEEPRWVSVRIMAHVTGRNEGRLLERWGPEAVPLSDPASPLTVSITRPESADASLQQLSSLAPPEASEPDEDGYFVRQGVTPPPRPNIPRMPPADTAYRLPAAQRLWPSPRDLVVICRRTGGPVRECRQTIITADRRVSVTWDWSEAGWQSPSGPATNYFPKPRWRELDLRLREVALFLLIDQDPGELQ